ncbi:unnamed protein product [Plutella xylostella]|uniref:(diamondback moth) hypothetical protein n=1 Tax=Plutella xylostella TaxID=51655 RepID=A0A8S4E7P3_PLUXY|nr:unnamed protein product [Plutella xylostella]
MGGIQYPHLNNLAKKIWQWCEERKIWMFASYINTNDNKDADEESRKTINPDIEMSLSEEAFTKIVHRLGQPEIDLFASRTNANQRCPPAREHTLAAARLCGSRSLEEELRRLP